MRKFTIITLLLEATSFTSCDNVAKPTAQSEIAKPAFDLETAKKEIAEVNIWN